MGYHVLGKATWFQDTGREEEEEEGCGGVGGEESLRLVTLSKERFFSPWWRYKPPTQSDFLTIFFSEGIMFLSRNALMMFFRT